MYKSALMLLFLAAVIILVSKNCAHEETMILDQ